LTGLQVHTDRMRENLARLEGSAGSADLTSAQVLVDRALSIFRDEEAIR
jgi:hypothetical protein